MTTIFKDFQMKAQTVDLLERTVEGYASTFDMDQVEDMIHAGAFQKSINERFPAGKIKLLWQHSAPIGIPLEMREDAKGLYVKARISKTRQGDEALQLAMDGVVDRFSIGFSIPNGKSEIDEAGIRHIYEAKLMEFSLVTFAANEAAVLTAVKHLRASIQKEAEAAAVIVAPVVDPVIEDTTPSQDAELNELKGLIDGFATFAKHRLY